MSLSKQNLLLFITHVLQGMPDVHPCGDIKEDN